MCCNNSARQVGELSRVFYFYIIFLKLWGQITYSQIPVLGLHLSTWLCILLHKEMFFQCVLLLLSEWITKQNAVYVLEVINLALFRPGINTRPGRSDHKTTALGSDNFRSEQGQGNTNFPDVFIVMINPLESRLMMMISLLVTCTTGCCSATAAFLASV